MINTNQIHSMTDFLRNHKAHVARLQESQVPEVLTINGSAAIVVQDARSYQKLLDRLSHMEMVASIRADMVRAEQNNPESAEVSETEFKRRADVMSELMAETDRLGLY